MKNSENRHYLIDFQRDKYNKKVFRIYEILAKLAIKYGCMGKYPGRYTDNQIAEMWNYDDSNPPPVSSLIKYAKLSVIKWMIRNEMTVNHYIWTSDFLHGVAENGVLKWPKEKFPSLKWYNNDALLRLIKTCPYGGDLYLKKEETVYNVWKYVPAFYLPYSNGTLDYLVGVLAGGKSCIRKEKAYARYSYTAAKYIEAIGIPVEYHLHDYILISPFWPALFSYKMPKEIGDSWFSWPTNVHGNIQSKRTIAAEANIYAIILWAVYVDEIFAPCGFPYLKSRRKIFYEFKCEEGLINKIYKLRMERKMTQLDNRFKEAVMHWANKRKKNEKETEVEENEEENINSETASQKLQVIGAN
jgi:hypothetical protein